PNVERLLVENPDSTVIVVADAETPSRLMVEAIEQARLAGASNVAIAASNARGGCGELRVSAAPFPTRAVFAALPLGKLGPRLGLWAGRLLIALAVNALLLWGVYRLVEGGQRQILEIRDLNFVDFVRLKEEYKPEPERPRPLPEKQPPLPDRPLDMPKLAMPQM
ncbi:MAG: ExbD/TolR family protein, partial [Candidatus Rokuibacteriota bacterium]